MVKWDFLNIDLSQPSVREGKVLLPEPSAHHPSVALPDTRKPLSSKKVLRVPYFLVIFKALPKKKSVNDRKTLQTKLIIGGYSTL